ncbi:AzlC family ABC transporter permease [Gemella cuniculi]|uniref:AzlC family ABC transporter permease n=1 Tax=Gemella cuniculi TaxID=150240 RepID=UPI0003FD28D6|nr:AzlC family ABC transporter permease [Gemella cuniculi]
MDNKLDVKTAIKDTLPTIFGYIGIGLAFGIIAKSAGFNIFLVAAMSLFIYAGSAQFITVSMLSVGSPIFPIVMATFLVNSRMILMSMTLAPYFRNYSMLKNISIGTLLTDESFALGMNKLNYTNGRLSYEWFNVVNAISYFTWIGASIVGAVLGDFIKNPYSLGLDFALVAMFIGLLYLQIVSDFSIKKKVQILVILFTLICIYLGMIFIPSSILVIVVTILGCGFGVILKNVLH